MWTSGSSSNASPRRGGFIVAVLGAESTGKTTLAQALGAHYRRGGRRVAVVGEYLREFCDRLGRTPHRPEQAAIAAEQTGRIAAAARDHDLVLADTTALMTAVYSDWVFGDGSLYAGAEAAHAACHHTLLTALDLAWEPDGLQRDSPAVREPIDAMIRASLARAGAAFSVVSGLGESRLAAAVSSIDRALSPPADDAARWRWTCAHCGEPDCERRSRSTR